MRELESEELLEHLPALQQLLYRLVGCRVPTLTFFIKNKLEFVGVKDRWPGCQFSPPELVFSSS